MEQVTMKLDRETFEKLHKQSRKSGCSIGEVVRRLVQSANLPGLDPNSKTDRDYLPDPQK